PETDEFSTCFTIAVCTDTSFIDESAFVQSRNYPYFTAQGMMETEDVKFDWVCLQSPDSASFAIVNMKLFDLRFGRTVFLFPKRDGSFLYSQLQTLGTDSLGLVNEIKESHQVEFSSAY
ncbi:MAG: DUF4855 domain-containing protein, partial [Flavobacteriales bacterium]|nr:DUF4855 domain-containing protein [Flavobacteriales bacterium]